MVQPARWAIAMAVTLTGLLSATSTPLRAVAATASGEARATAQLPALDARAASQGIALTVVANQTPPAGAISPNLEFLSNLPIASAISIVFIGATAYVSTVVGLYSVDISDPTNPQLLGALPMTSGRTST